MSTTTASQAPHISLITKLRQKIEDNLGDWVNPGDRAFAFLDVPNHENIGDSAIYVGTVKYLKSRNIAPAYIASADRFNSEEMDLAIQDGPIYVHGGGNLGDVWPWFQDFRERILERYKGREIVQLPQTIHFSSQDKIDQFARIVEKHGNYKLLVRDQPSYELATKNFQCQVRLCPDMAFCIPPIARPHPDYEILLHLRKDLEAKQVHDTQALLDGVSVFQKDWPDEHKTDKLFMRAQSLGCAILTGSIFKGQNAMLANIYAQMASIRFNRGIKILGQAQYVVTDRLHGHIMCTLAGIPHCVLDNSYGKISRFISAWDTKVEHTYTASTVDEAVNILRQNEKSR